MNDLVERGGQMAERHGGGIMSVEDVANQISQIQKLMKGVMKEDVHFGTIPGTDKPALFKAGAEKIGLMFGLRSDYRITQTDLDNGHREYEIVCRLHDRAGNHIGEGIGVCSTQEKKYRYRTDFTNLPVPKEYWETKDQSLLGGSNCAPRKVKGQWQIVRMVEYENPADYYNCVTADTKLLTHDLRWVPAGEIQSGDLLVGVEEEMDSQYARHMAVGEAEVFGTKTDTIYEVVFMDGRRVKCNGEHPWLVKKVGLKGTEWVSTQDIFADMNSPTPRGRPRHWSVMSICRPWNEDVSKEAGYLAGALDADGSLGCNQGDVQFAQQENIVLRRVQSVLEERGFKFSLRGSKTQAQIEDSISGEQVYSGRVLGGFAEQMRLIGSVRPPRLLERWMRFVDFSSRRLEGKGSGAGKAARIASISKIGEGEVVLLGTSCKTYIAEGLVCHNTTAKMAKKRAYIDAITTCTAASDFFEQEEVFDTPEVFESKPSVEETVDAPRQQPKARQDASGTLTAPQLKVIRKKAESQGITETLICEEFSVDNIENIPAGQANNVLEWLDTVSG